MFNIGLEVLQPRMGEIPEDWSMEQFYEIANELDRGLDALTNLVAIRNSMVKYGKTPQLTHLVGGSLEEAGITFSTEGIWETIKNFFRWIKEKIVAAWKWFWGLFGFYKNDANTAKELAKTAKEVVNEKDPKKRKEKQSFLKKLGNMLSRKRSKAEESYSFSTEERLGYLVAYNVPNLKDLEESQQIINSITEKWKNIALSLRNSTPTEEQFTELKKIYDEAMEFVEKSKQPEYLKMERITTDIYAAQRSIDITKKNFDTYETVMKIEADNIKRLQSKAAEAESKFKNNPNNNDFKRCSDYLKMEVKLISESIRISNKIVELGKEAMANAARAIANAD